MNEEITQTESTQRSQGAAMGLIEQTSAQELTAVRGKESNQGFDGAESKKRANLQKGIVIGV